MGKKELSVDADSIKDGVLNMLRVNMGVKRGERVLVATDIPSPKHWAERDAEYLADASRRCLLARAVCDIAREELDGCSVDFLPYPSTGQSGTEPDAATAARLKEADVIVIITTHSLSHTNAREEACRAGARVASMPGFIPEMFFPGGVMVADYEQISRVTSRLADLITGTKEAHVTCPAGTDVRFSVEGRRGGADDGIYRESGRWGNLPAGEAYTAPLEGTASGTLVVRAGWHPRLDENMTLRFERGLVTACEGGGKVGAEFRELLRPGDRSQPYASRQNLGELGIGTNPNAKRTDITLEAEKILGTVHLAIGDGSHLGGDVESDLHEDFVIPEPTLELDGVVVMKDGKLV